MHPPPNGAPAFVAYRVNKMGKLFHASVFQPLTAASPVTYDVIGDGKVLWQSKTGMPPRAIQNCSVSIEGVDILLLRASCAGDYLGAHAAWFEPYIELAAITRPIPRPKTKVVYLSQGQLQLTVQR